jgi:hypothetical protein
MTLRKPAVQGLFYPNSKALLEKQFEKILEGKNGNSTAVISPHAGLIYSGKTQGKSINSLSEKPNYVILCPNHTGLGKAISVFPEGKWKTLLGEAEINAELSKKIIEKIPEAALDEEAHFQEHSAEMQLLLLQKKFSNFKICVICIAEHSLQLLKKLGKALFELSEEFDFAVIASSDFTHFEPEESARQKDLEAIEKILENDAEGFHKLVMEKQLSICGFAGITALLEFAKLKGLKGKLLEYTSSAETTHDKSNVVGYASIIFE